MKINIYVEGGGDSPLQDLEFRRGWKAFFNKAGLNRMPRVVRGRGRRNTMEAYANALKHPSAGELPLLLVDSEDLVTSEAGVWSFLKARDGWVRPAGSGDGDAFLMICCMETWFIADRKTLGAFFPELIERHIKAWPDLEKVPKETIFAALKQATAKCAKKYDKGRVSSELLSLIEPAAVESECPAAALFLNRLRALLN